MFIVARSKETAVGNRIRALRKQQGLTVKRLAEETGLSASALANYEYGFREPNARAMVALEQYFEVSGAYLRGETDETARPSWENTEVMAEVGKELPGLLERMGEQLAGTAPEVQKLAFDLLVELKHLLNQPDPAVQAAGVRLLAGCLTQCTLYLDALERYDPETGRSRPARARDQAQGQIAAALQQAMDELCPRPAKPKAKPPAQP